MKLSRTKTIGKVTIEEYNDFPFPMVYVNGLIAHETYEQAVARVEKALDINRVV